jgi:hypothetical protein
MPCSDRQFTDKHYTACSLHVSLSQSGGKIKLVFRAGLKQNQTFWHNKELVF